MNPNQPFIDRLFSLSRRAAAHGHKVWAARLEERARFELKAARHDMYLAERAQRRFF